MPPEGQTLRQPGQKIGVDQHVQQAISQPDNTQPPFHSPAGTAGQAAGGALMTQLAGGSVEQPKAEVEVVGSIAGTAVQGRGGAGVAAGSGAA
eukprot:9492257-Pyramimonas_sp.AAC.1